MEGLVGKAALGMAAAVALSIPAMVASFIPFENAMARLETVSTASVGTLASEMARASEEARTWSAAHLQSATQVIQAETELATAGLKTHEVLIGVAQASVLATATGDGLAESARFLASLFNTFGEAGKGKEGPEEFFQRASDSMAEAIKRFQMQMVPLREGMAFITAQMVEMGQTGSASIADAATALGILNTAGLRGSVAGAALQNVFMKMDEAVEKLGLDVTKFTDEFGRVTSINDFIDEMASKLMEGRTAFDQLNTANEVFGIRGAKAALILAQQRDNLRSNSEEIRNATGAAKHMAEIIERTTGSQLVMATNRAKVLAQTVGESLAPAFISVLGAVQGAFSGMAAWAEKLGGWSPIILLITAGVVGWLGVMSILNTVLAVTGAELVTVTAAMIAFSAALLRISLIGTAVFAALTVIIGAFRTTDVKSRLFEGLEKTNFSPIIEGLKGVAHEADKAEGRLAELNRTKGLIEKGNIDVFNRPKVQNSDGTISTVRSMSAGFDGVETLIPTVSDVGRIMSATEAIKQFQETGRHLGKFSSPEAATEFAKGLHDMYAEGLLDTDVFAAKTREKIVGAFTALGLDKQIAGEFATATNAAIAKMRDLGMGTADATRAAGAALSELANAPLGAVGEGAAKVLGGVEAAGEKFLNWFNTTFKTSLTTASDAFEALRAKTITGHGGGSQVGGAHPGDILKGLNELFPSEAKAGGTEAVKQYVRNIRLFMETFGKKEIQDAIRATSPELMAEVDSVFSQLGLKGMPAFASAFEKGSGGQLEKIRSWMQKFFNDPTNDVMAMEVGMRIQKLIQQGLGSRLASARPIIGDLVVSEGATERVRLLGEAFKNAQGHYNAIADSMKKGISGEKIEAARQFVDKMTNALKAMDETATTGLAATQRALEALPDALRGTDVEKGLKSRADELLRMGESARSSIEPVTQMMEELRGLGPLLREPISEQALKGGSKAMAGALDDTLLLGNLESFRQQLFDKSSEGLRQGIIQGAVQGFLAASQLGRFFETDEIAAKIKSAIELSTKGNVIDPSALKANLGDVGKTLIEGMKGQDLSSVFGVLSDFTLTITQQFAQATGMSQEFFRSVYDDAEKASSGLKKQIDGISELRVAMLTATQEQKFYIQDLISLKERSGTVGGVNIGTADVRTQIELAAGLYKDAADRFGKSSEIARGFGEVLKEAFSKLQEGESLEKRFGFKDAADSIDRLEKGASAFSKALSGPIGVKAEVATVADDLERGKTAAEGILDALQKIQAGNVLPSTVNVSGGGGGASGPVTITLGGIQIIMDVGAAITQEDLNKLRERLDKEWEQKRDAILTEVRSRK